MTNSSRVAIDGALGERVNRVVFRENKYPMRAALKDPHQNSAASGGLNRAVYIYVHRDKNAHTRMQLRESARAMFISRPRSCNFPSRYELSNSPDVIRLNGLPNEFINSPAPPPCIRDNVSPPFYRERDTRGGDTTLNLGDKAGEKKPSQSQVPEKVCGAWK